MKERTPYKFACSTPEERDIINLILNDNNILINKYPFLKKDDNEKTKNHSTWLDDMPIGWRFAFGELLCEDIQKVIEEEHIRNYQIMQIKEKFGELRWYAINSSERIEDIIDIYTYISRHICSNCGEITNLCNLNGYIIPICQNCFSELNVVGEYEEYVKEKPKTTQTVKIFKNGKYFDKDIDLTPTLERIKEHAKRYEKYVFDDFLKKCIDNSIQPVALDRDMYVDKNATRIHLKEGEKNEFCNTKN